MSTNKTQNYGLHTWEAGDDFLREEFNENFAAIDEGIFLNVFVTGSYEGTGTSGESPRTIELGFRPRVVLLMGNMSGGNTHLTPTVMALVIDGVRTDKVTLTDTGFTVTYQLNQKDDYYNPNPYRFIAWR